MRQRPLHRRYRPNIVFSLEKSPQRIYEVFQMINRLLEICDAIFNLNPVQTRQ
jgi:hypothetical protein